jgi:hypothetical protein
MIERESGANLSQIFTNWGCCSDFLTDALLLALKRRRKALSKDDEDEKGVSKLELV